ncbi:MAG: hypothetical protein ABIK68_12180, partial [bacterium]
MKPEEQQDDQQIKINHPGSEFDPSVAFIQVPVKIKDKVEEYINSIAEIADSKKLASRNAMEPFQSQGCFFVISLERVEEIIGYLRNAADPR